MKYASIPEADCRVLDTVRANMVPLGGQLQSHATPNVMPCFIVFRRSSNTIHGLVQMRLGIRYMDDGSWYIDLASSVGMTPSF